MNVELAFIKFRIKQFYRFLETIGLINLLIVIPVGLIVSLSIVGVIEKPYSIYLALLYPAVTISTHTQRKDNVFLKKIRVSRLRLYVVEYTLLCFPLSVVFLLKGYWKAAVTGHLIVVFLCLVFLKYSLSTPLRSRSWRLAIIPDALFEWKTSIRLYRYNIAIIWISGAFAAMNEYAYFLFLLLCASIASATFKPSEGKELRPVTVSQLWVKIKDNTLFLLVWLIPHIAVFLSLNFSHWYVIAGSTLYLTLYQLYCICYKYSVYAQDSDSANGIPTAIFTVLCPILPVSIPLIIYTYRQAKNRIKHA